MGKGEGESLETEFASGTTCHGFNRLAVAKKWPHRAFWTVAILWGFGMTTWMISSRIEAYFKYETSTEIRVEEKYALEFPAVTFCNFNKYRRSAMTALDWYIYANSKLAEKYAFEADYDPEATAALRAAFEGFEANLTATYPGGFDFGNFTRRIGWELNNETMPLCLFRMKQCFPENFTHAFQSEYGNCYTFNSHHDEDSLSLQQTRPGAQQGLYILFDIQQAEYTELLSLNGALGVGIDFQIHSWYERPNVAQHGLGAGVGTAALVSMHQNELQNLAHPWGNCSNDRTLKHFPRYSRSGCEVECYLEKVLELCGCKPFSYPGNAVNCNPVDQVLCADPTIFKVASNFQKECGARCPEACQIIEYPPTVSYAPFPNYYMAQELASMYGTNANYASENLVGLSIYYKDLNNRLTKKNPAMTPSGLLSDIGGQLGLFIGMSTLTLMEFGEYIIFKIIQCCRKRKPKTSQSKESGM
ncbi:acid-sensing ion channel 5 isoform X2 [Lingula anatina]|uniref:Acid-sensing ion channel 5 isoform X2 n=1 Tax=Lingula anatina TaxID=7574 RepID=A0A1S3IVQ2_LINAN|nr:acid-sensing ion channel 5 isoform X2 [Lingula anatina]|eukprot:XP_013402272.1 acid-sensing ion channel 5 isoform X2 [Lingula anatina]